MNEAEHTIRRDGRDRVDGHDTPLDLRQNFLSAIRQHRGRNELNDVTDAADGQEGESVNNQARDGRWR